MNKRDVTADGFDPEDSWARYRDHVLREAYHYAPKVMQELMHDCFMGGYIGGALGALEQSSRDKGVETIVARIQAIKDGASSGKARGIPQR